MSISRVLVVEDHREFSGQIRRILARCAAVQVVGQAFNGLEAISKAEELRPDVVLLDIGLPKMNGLRVADYLRSIMPTARIAFVTQESSPDVIQQAFNSGGRAYVHKCRIQLDLLCAIDALLTGKQFVSRDLACGTLDSTFPLPV